MMRKLDQRGGAAFEFCLIAVAFFTLIFTIFDLARYAITMQSLRALAGAQARAIMLDCYVPTGVSDASTCTSSNYTLTNGQMQNAAPFLFQGGLTPNLTASQGASAWTITASQPKFSVAMPLIWGTSLNNPSASTEVPF